MDQSVDYFFVFETQRNILDSLIRFVHGVSRVFNFFSLTDIIELYFAQTDFNTIAEDVVVYRMESNLHLLVLSRTYK